MFGLFDLVALTDAGILGIQATSGSNHAARRKKMLANPLLANWINANGRAECWSWSKRGKQGQRKVWTLRREAIACLETLTAPR